MTHICDDPCILFALRRESAPFCRAFHPHQSFPNAPCWARSCGPLGQRVLVVETGIGQANVARALDWLLGQPKLDAVPYRPKLLLFAGFAGALTDTLHVGDVIFVDEVLDAHGNRWPTTWPKKVSALLPGRLLTTDRLIGVPQDKRRLGEQFAADAVDMESALFAARCTQAGIPFACMRAISDEVTTPLSAALTTLLCGGTVSPWRLVSALARHPFMISELLRLGRDTKRASERLGLALGELLALPVEDE